MKIKLFFTFILIFLFSIPVFSAEQMRIVVMNLKADGVSDRTARTVTNMLRTEFINIGKFTVVERAQMDAILEEQGLQQTGCTDQECAVQIGKLMSAKKIMVGEVSPMGNSIVMTIRIVDVEKGISEFAASQKAESEDVLDVAVAKIARNIAARIEGQAPPVAETAPRREPAAKKKEPAAPGEKTMAGYYLRGFVPGWGQFYAGRTIKGIVFLGGFAATGVLTFLSFVQYNDLRDKYESLGENASQEDFDKAYEDYEKAAPQIMIFAAATLGVYVLNWLDILILSRPNYAENHALPVDGNRVFYTFDTYKSSRFNETKVKLGLGMRF